MRANAGLWLCRAGRAGLAMAAVCTLSTAMLLGVGGCQVLGFGGAMAESYKRNSTHSIDPEYTGLTGKTFAVLIATDRIIESDYPEVVLRLTQGITERLSKGAGGTAMPPETVLTYQYNNPRWRALTYEELAKELGVQRLIYVDLYEYRLNDPGNQYLWEGVAAGDVLVIEADGRMPEEIAFRKPVKVSFPDKTGYGPGDMTQQLVASELTRRFIDRGSWFFYKHEEPYYPKY
jgi:hypothetical protein